MSKTKTLVWKLCNSRNLPHDGNVPWPAIEDNPSLVVTDRDFHDRAALFFEVDIRLAFCYVVNSIPEPFFDSPISDGQWFPTWVKFRECGKFTTSYYIILRRPIPIPQCPITFFRCWGGQHCVVWLCPRGYSIGRISLSSWRSKMCVGARYWRMEAFLWSALAGVKIICCTFYCFMSWET